ncbi:MAG: Rid family hydrolase [Streptosporangiaceae bacterium]|jgi:enamine deaminase RidA (YjgF/YER057c/UK114 family)
MNLERINPAELGRPSGFSHAVSVPAGRLVFLAGQLATGRGGQPADLVSLTIYLIDVEDYQAHGRQIGAVWRRLAGTEYPAMAGVGVTRLWDPEALVELQGIAAVG